MARGIITIACLLLAAAALVSARGIDFASPEYQRVKTCSRRSANPPCHVTSPLPHTYLSLADLPTNFEYVFHPLYTPLCILVTCLSVSCVRDRLLLVLPAC
eukprot:TRINITY_DN428_c0_g1_i2.p1 TRINITY_DN428_c0_g1~~TRINITY_DN428_c0_g1_i2.p1  ORF type:complete len:101 (-),score=7.41 TRINITY_DN428_c0_g1_i2:6-308(-)